MTDPRPSRSDAVIEIDLEDGGLIFLTAYTAPASPGTIARQTREGLLSWSLTRDEDDPYVAITAHEGHLSASSWRGHRFEIDIERGAASPAGFTK